MTESWTLGRAFAFFGGAAGRNPRWSWSARSADGQTIVLTLWEDEITDDGHTVIADFFGHRNLHIWTDKPGNRERIDNLIWARDHCDGLFRVVMVRAEDTQALPRSIASLYPHQTLVMKLVELDEGTGEFRAESVRR